jgi:hypothetical protein
VIVRCGAVAQTGIAKMMDIPSKPGREDHFLTETRRESVLLRASQFVMDA